jgi:molybdopterin-guanine dinucleotide biosynthesis protein A
VARAERRVNAVVLAGGPADAVAATVPGLPNKAFVPIGGVALVERVIAALRATHDIERIIAVAPPAAHGAAALAGADERRADGARMVESLAAGIAGLDPDTLVLIAASDLPVLSARAVADFLTQAKARDLDLAYAVVEKRDHLAAYPAVPHTWAKLAREQYCGGGLVALKPRVMPALRTVLDDLGAARKSPLRLAGLFGWDILLRFALGTLAVADAERRASRILGAPAGAIRSTFPDLAVNVDRVTDIALANGLVPAASKTAG